MHSLRTTLTLIIAVAYLGASVAIGAAFFIAASIGNRYATRFDRPQARLEKSVVISLIDSELGLSQKLANNPAIRGWLTVEGDPARPLWPRPNWRAIGHASGIMHT